MNATINQKSSFFKSKDGKQLVIVSFIGVVETHTTIWEALDPEFIPTS